MVGPVSIGINRFVLQANAPNPQSINNQDLIGVTVILITCSFMDNKFVQIGYYVNNEYSEPFEPENFPNPVDISKLYRNILADQPRVTRFPIDWSGEASAAIASLDGVPVMVDAGQSEEIDEDEVSFHSYIFFNYLCVCYSLLHSFFSCCMVTPLLTFIYFQCIDARRGGL